MRKVKGLISIAATSTMNMEQSRPFADEHGLPIVVPTSFAAKEIQYYEIRE